jgi:hypothetical protein
VYDLIDIDRAWKALFQGVALQGVDEVPVLIDLPFPTIVREKRYPCISVRLRSVEEDATPGAREGDCGDYVDESFDESESPAIATKTRKAEPYVAQYDIELVAGGKVASKHDRQLMLASLSLLPNRFYLSVERDGDEVAKLYGIRLGDTRLDEPMDDEPLYRRVVSVELAIRLVPAGSVTGHRAEEFGLTVVQGNRALADGSLDPDSVVVDTTLVLAD